LTRVSACWSGVPLAGGLASGKYRRDGQPTHGTRQLIDRDEPPTRDREALYRTVDVLVSISQARGVSAAQVALAYLLERPAVPSLMIGTRTAEQLADKLAAELVLTAPERE
jgi:aryl-alcohol dehydrogenase-like predicted oxidoreductase